MDGGGLDICQMWDGPVYWWEVLVPFAVLTPLAAVAGWLRGSRLRGLRALGTVLLGLVALISLVDSLFTYRWGVSANATCTAFVDSRITAAIVIVLAACVIMSARLARLRSPKPEARGPKPS